VRWTIQSWRIESLRWRSTAPTPGGWPGSWTEVLGWQITEREGADVRIAADRDAPFAIDFLVVPDGPKQTKNRLHLDLSPTDRLQEAELARLISLGAVEVDIGQRQVSWHVLADPEGNEFCLLRSRVDPPD